MESRVGPAAAVDLCWRARPRAVGSGSPGRLRPTLRQPPIRRTAPAFSCTPGRHPVALPLGPRPGGSPRARGLWSQASSSPESPSEHWLFLFTTKEKEGEGTLSETRQIPRALFSIPSGIFSSNPDHPPSPFSERKLLRFREKKSRLKRRFMPSLSGHRHASLT